ncbi:MAG: response regulator [Planctomycetes bacterium]|nr:response regulator [Planctomycetota bacterium]
MPIERTQPRASSSSSGKPAGKPKLQVEPPRGVIRWLYSLSERSEGEPWYRAYLSVVVAVCVAAMARTLLDPLFGDSAPYGMFLIAVVYIAWSRGLAPSIATIALGIPAATYLFVEPRHSLFIGEKSSIANLFMSLSLGVLVSLFSESLRMAASENRRLYQIAKRAELRKDEFLAMLAHELRNPLAPIRNALYLLENQPRIEPEVKVCHDLIAKQVDYLLRLMEDLLDVSRITRGAIELRIKQARLADVIEGAVQMSRPLVTEKRQELKVSLPDDELYLNADQVRLTQILANLLNNASRYTEANGQIWLTVEAADHDLTMRVRDTGRGIAAQDLQRVFELFEQVEGQGQSTPGGLGIGLTLVRRLVELHGGQVEARSPGRGLGSEFVVRLPNLLVEPPKPSRPTAPLTDETTHHSRRVLVVDDNVASATSLAKVLGLWHHDVQVCHDGFTAIEAARAFRPEVVLADIGLPRMNGYQLAGELRQIPSLEHTLLVAVTGYGQDEDRQRAEAAGFDRHLLKPVNPDELAELLDSEFSK